MFRTNKFEEYAERCHDHAHEVKCIMHTSILKDLLDKFHLDYIVRVELVAISNRDADVYVRVVLQDMAYIAKYSFMSFLTRHFPPDLKITPTIMPHDIDVNFFKNMSYSAASTDAPGMVVDHDYIKKYADICKESPFRLLYVSS